MVCGALLDTECLGTLWPHSDHDLVSVNCVGAVHVTMSPCPGAKMTR